ncbi:hypothetical protein [Mycoplasma tauri]|uniref:Uncharacterized protein n=1 Tax=Mycoplasma tauri TaxID=547987 RepID=A0A953NGS5_9MOLU|nr:hypothetical protein [Mycoplasma tauri]MBZ4195401.1 hypothetical protein [Mycoplasma tauri]MBZ4203548.1 hypothetical protein [Mycoplasma tauri]MBZ4218407.1 hypothetical protein [Mycoplasma tauri]MBZ4226935.1 hypothetical protein [Mycoplasma tauri]QSB07689.1 hypothetical protein JS510_01025 [Mycoplasma tauri]
MNTKTNIKEKEKITKNSKKWTIISVIFIILFFAILAVLIAYVADFIRFKDSLDDGLLWTFDQRKHGLFNFWNK